MDCIVAAIGTLRMLNVHVCTWPNVIELLFSQYTMYFLSQQERVICLLVSGSVLTVLPLISNLLKGSEVFMGKSQSVASYCGNAYTCQVIVSFETALLHSLFKEYIYFS